MSLVEKARPGRRPDPALRAAWEDRLLRQEQSGLSAPAFCSRERLSLSAFHSWRRRLKPKEPPAAAPLPLLPVGLLSAAPTVELLLPTGAALRLAPGCDLDLVRAVLALLAEGPPC